MSLNFQDPINKKDQEFIKEFFGDRLEVVDERTALLNTRSFAQSEMKTLTNRLNQVVELELNGDDEIKTMADGTRYKVTPEGWRKIASEGEEL